MVVVVMGDVMMRPWGCHGVVKEARGRRGGDAVAIDVLEASCAAGWLFPTLLRRTVCPCNET